MIFRFRNFIFRYNFADQKNYYYLIMDPNNLLLNEQQFMNILTKFDTKNQDKNIQWATESSAELPVMVCPEENLEPMTLIQLFQNTLKLYPDWPALTVKKGKQSVTKNFLEYYEAAKAFGNALISLQITHLKSVNIIGFNAPEWHISFYGSIFGGYLPVGVYTTNQADSCKYVAENSDCEVVVVENKEHLKKYLSIWDQLPNLKAIVIYNDESIVRSEIPNDRLKQVFQWKAFLELGRQFKEDELLRRMKQQKPGNCCTLVYTSGTTGMPKGVMLSHDNYIWTSITVIKKYKKDEQKERIVSYLPLSHVAAQIIDIIGTVYSGTHVYFATPDALQGSLVETLREVRPTFFFSVPRVWEKIEEKMKQIAMTNRGLKRSIANWAKSIGVEQTYNEAIKRETSFGFKVAKFLVYDNVKKALGLDQAKFMLFGAAPLSPQIRKYFLSLNFPLINAYGMSESSGPQTLSDPEYFGCLDEKFLTSAGNSLRGTQIKIVNPDKEGNGEICYKGRNRFMGYYKNEEATKQTIDREGFLHSGDIGKLDEKGNLWITGRLKELIITAGGENIAPVMIENNVKQELPVISNCMLIGEQKNFLALLVALKQKTDKEGKLLEELSDEVLHILQEQKIGCRTVSEAKGNKQLHEMIEAGIQRANERAISRAQHIRKWVFLNQDFTVEDGDLTPTLKLRRSVVIKKNMGLIESLYRQAKL